MKNRRIAWLLLMLLTIPLGLFAQNITVKGVVTDSEGEPIIGASVIEKGKSGNGTITNLDGNFTLNVSGKNKKLVISYIGMTTQEVDAATGKVIKVVLHDDAQALDEVVVIGYGTSKRGDLTERYSRYICRKCDYRTPCRCKCSYYRRFAGCYH